MIQKINKGNGFRGTLNYVLDKEHAELIGGNMAGDNAKDLSAEFGVIRSMSNSTRPVFHTSISLAESDGKLSDEQWTDITSQYMKHMGFENNQYVFARHSDTDLDHIHIIANRVDMDTGKLVSDSQDFKRGEQILRQLEQQYDLTLVQSSEQTLEKAPTRGELQVFEQTGEISIKMQLQGLVKAAAHDAPAFKDFVANLHSSGVEIIPNLQSTGRVSGITYELDNEKMKGGDLGKAFTFNGIQKQLGVVYEQNRDAEIISELKERAAHRELERLDRQAAIERDSDRRTDGRDIGADRGIDRQSDTGIESQNIGIDQGTAGIHKQAHERDIGAAISDGIEGGRHETHGQRVERGIDERGERLQKGSTNAEMEMAGNDRSHAGNDRYTSYDHILDLAANIRSKNQPVLNYSRAKSYDTGVVMQQQMKAMGCQRFDISIRDEKTGKNMDRLDKTMQEVMDMQGFLRSHNAHGAHICIRPARNHKHDLVLIDDLNQAMIEKMRKNGYEPAAIIETSPNNYQCWMKHGESLTKDETGIIAKAFASYCNADKSSTDHVHYGRLAGFTNVKTKHLVDGRSPYSKLIDNSGSVYQNAAQTLNNTRKVVEQQKEQERQQALARQIQQQTTERHDMMKSRNLRTLADFHNDKKYEGDMHRADMAWAVYAARKRLPTNDIVNELKHGRDLSHKGNDKLQEDYAERTATKAVLTVEKEREHERTQSRGWEHGM